MSPGERVLLVISDDHGNEVELCGEHGTGWDSSCPHCWDDLAAMDSLYDALEGSSE